MTTGMYFSLLAAVYVAPALPRIAGIALSFVCVALAVVSKLGWIV